MGRKPTRRRIRTRSSAEPSVNHLTRPARNLRSTGRLPRAAVTPVEGYAFFAHSSSMPVFTTSKSGSTCSTSRQEKAMRRSCFAVAISPVW